MECRVVSLTAAPERKGSGALMPLIRCMAAEEVATCTH